MRRLAAALAGRTPVTACAVAVTLAPFAVVGGWVAAVLAVLGLIGCVVILAGWPGGVTLVCCAAIGHVAIAGQPGAGGVLIVAALLGLLLGAAETAESGRWRLGVGALRGHAIRWAAGLVAVVVALSATGVGTPGASGATVIALIGAVAAAWLVWRGGSLATLSGVADGGNASRRIGETAASGTTEQDRTREHPRSQDATGKDMP